MVRSIIPAVVAVVCSASGAAAQTPPVIDSYESDSRGRITLGVGGLLDPQTVTENAVEVSVPGDDGVISTDDDPAVSTEVSYSLDENEIVIEADVAAGQPYSVRLDASMIATFGGVALDGEFNGAGEPSGDGEPGGDLEFFAKPALGNSILRMETILGVIELELFTSDTPITAENFLNYVNDADYDSSFFHRSVEDFVIQGGGFTAEDDLPAIPTDDPIMNEPGISNTRGTIAMAKLSGDPNSATSQFFFNLTDNPNLDTQNGGFTVFGEITDQAGLDVMDAIAELPIVDASDQGAAFGELPVLSEEEFEEAGEAGTDNLAVVQRAASLYDVVAEPFNSFDDEQITDITAPGSDAVVHVIDVADEGIGAPSGYVEVIFGNGDSIKQIRLHDPFPDDPVLLHIRGASDVGSIKDMRKNGGALAGIVSESPVGAIQLLNPVEGAMINDTLLPGGMLLPPDIDGDGINDDPTAVFIEEGLLKMLQVKGDLRGDVVVNEGVEKVQVTGSTEDMNLVFLDPENDTSLMQFGAVENSAIDAPGVFLKQLRADSWTGGSMGRVVRAEAIGTLLIKDGDFDAGLELMGELTDNPLQKAMINGGVNDSTWTVFGNAGNIFIKGEADDWTCNVDGTVNIIKLGSASGSSIFTSERTNRLLVDGNCNFTDLSFESANRIDIKGEYSGAMNLRDDPVANFGINTIRIFDDLHNAEIFLERGAGMIDVMGDTEDVAITSADDINTVNLRHVENCIIDNEQDINNIKAIRWLGGEIRANAIGKLIVTGGNGTPGTLEADVLTDQISLLRTDKGGDYKGMLSIIIPERIHISGGMQQSTASLGSNFIAPNAQISNEFIVKGPMVLTDIRARNSMGMMSFGAMIDSSIYIRAPTNLNGFPASGANIGQGGRIDGILVEPPAGDTGFENSYVIADEIGEAIIGGIDTSSGAANGIGVSTIDKATLIRENGSFVQLDSPGVSPPALGSFQLRVDFAEPPE